MHAVSSTSRHPIVVDVEDVTDQLEREGLAKFEKSWNQLNHHGQRTGFPGKWPTPAFI